MIETITGDLLVAPEKYIVHQTNCVSMGRAGGLAYFLFKQFPYADCYSDRAESSVPGTLDIRGDGINDRLVVNLHGQYFPGGPLDDEDGTEYLDTAYRRQKYFHKALLRLAKVENLESVAFPYCIGCGIAGGDWTWYEGTINNFAKYIKEKQGASTVIYQREEDKPK